MKKANQSGIKTSNEVALKTIQLNISDPSKTAIVQTERKEPFVCLCRAV